MMSQDFCHKMLHLRDELARRLPFVFCCADCGRPLHPKHYGWNPELTKKLEKIIEWRDER